MPKPAYYDDEEPPSDQKGNGRIKHDRGQGGGNVELSLSSSTGKPSALGLMRATIFGRLAPFAVDITHEPAPDPVGDGPVNQRTQAEVTWSTGRGGGTIICDVPAMFVVPGAEYVDARVSLQAFRVTSAAAFSGSVRVWGSITEVASPNPGGAVIRLTRAYSMATGTTLSTLMAAAATSDLLLLEQFTKGIRIYAQGLTAATAADNLELRWRVNTTGVGLGNATLYAVDVTPGAFYERPAGAQAFDLVNNGAGTVVAVVVQELAV